MTFTTLFIWLVGLLFIFACLWLILVVLMQEGKSGGMAGLESASQSPSALTDAFGAGGAQKTLFRVTGWSAGIFFFLAISLTVLGNYRERGVTLLGVEDEEATEAVAPDVTEQDPFEIEVDGMMTEEGAPIPEQDPGEMPSEMAPGEPPVVPRPDESAVQEEPQD